MSQPKRISITHVNGRWQLVVVDMDNNVSPPQAFDTAEAAYQHAAESFSDIPVYQGRERKKQPVKNRHFY